MLITILICLAAVGYLLVGYPALLWLIVRIRGPRPIRQAAATDELPRVSLVISAFNEAPVIAAKLTNSLDLDYPADRLEIVVVSDASSDGTDDIVREFAARVRLERLPGRLGKTAGLNQVLPTLTGDIVVFSDANSIYAADALRMLVRNFADPEVGCVTGESQYVGGETESAGIGERAYWSYEMRLKRLETQVGSMVGGDGAIYALRRELWTPLPLTAINDFLNPLQVVARGRRGVYEPAAICREAPAAEVGKEYRRRIRIVSRSWRAVFQARAVLNPFRVGFFAVSVASHKMLRWLVGIPTFVGLAATVAIVLDADWLDAVPPAGWLALAAGALLLMAVSRVPTIAAYYLILQLASLVGVVYGSLGRVSGTWSTPRDDAGGRATGSNGGLVPLWLGVLAIAVGGVWSFGWNPDTASRALFWGSAGSLAYVYVGYPIVLFFLSRALGRPARPDAVTPSVCLLIAANDEATVIRDKIDNALALDYPADRLRVLVASDGSVDATNAIVESFTDPRVSLLALPVRRGKMAATNTALAAIDDVEVVAFCDANTLLAPDALRCLVRPFADACIGAVSGNVVLVGDRAAWGLAEDLYYRYERWLQQAESRIGSMVGVDGGFYAVRRALYEPPPDDTILDDVAVPLAVVRQGFRVVLAPDAMAREPGSKTSRDELGRKSRVIAGAVQLVSRWASLPRRPWQIVFSMISHKMLRWLSPAFVLGTFAGSLWLGGADPIFQLLALSQVLLLGLGLLGCVPAIRRLWPAGMAHYFVLMHVAAALGLSRGLVAGQPAAWARFTRIPLSDSPEADATRDGR